MKSRVLSVLAALAVCLAVLAAGQAPASATGHPILVHGHDVSTSEWERITSDQWCGQYSAFWEGWWENGCSTKVREGTFDRAPVVPVPKLRDWTEVSYGTIMRVRTVQKGGTLVAVRTMLHRLPLRMDLCDWRVDLEYEAGGRVWLIDRGPEKDRDPDCISVRNNLLHQERNGRLVLPRFVPLRGQVCAQLFVGGQRREERVCVPITAG